MPRLNPKSSPAYGKGTINNSLSFRERLMDRFQAHEYVRVINPDTAPIVWQYLPTHAEHITMTPDPIQDMHRDDVEQYMLNPGESEVILGENAYVMIEALYKQIVAKKTIEASPDIDETRARNFNYTDANKQEYWIDKILIGKETPNFGNFEREVEEKPRGNTQAELRKHVAEQTA